MRDRSTSFVEVAAPTRERMLGCSAIHILRCWQDNLAYNPIQYRALQALLDTTDKAG